MAVIKATDLAFGRLRSPDLDQAEEFLTHFGFTKADRTRTALYMRGTDAPHHIHITELGEPKVVGIGFHAASEEDLHKLAKLPVSSAVESVDEPGGGKRVRLKEPNGFQIEVFHGMQRLAPIPVDRQPTNSGREPLARAGRLMRLPASPAPIKRIGHAVFATPKVLETAKWFREHLGLICSDDIYVEHRDNVIGSFNRLDRGEEYVDHHATFFIHNEKRAGLNHLSFEVPDMDAVLKDHEYLRGLGKYEHMWGVGRHLLGSQVYDYWADPWGRVHERWADTDRLNAANGSNYITPEQGFQSQWGERPPEKFRGTAVV
jgi:catechol 2,3-dioxygenase-like lactoylglutathione lyase family enzyme